jgi:hypothetical protein
LRKSVKIVNIHTFRGCFTPQLAQSHAAAGPAESAASQMTPLVGAGLQHPHIHTRKQPGFTDTRHYTGPVPAYNPVLRKHAIIPDLYPHTTRFYGNTPLYPICARIQPGLRINATIPDLCVVTEHIVGSVYVAHHHALRFDDLCAEMRSEKVGGWFRV